MFIEWAQSPMGSLVVIDVIEMTVVRPVLRKFGGALGGGGGSARSVALGWSPKARP